MTDWTLLLPIVLTIGFGITTIVLAIKLAKRREPVWAYETTKLIGLGSDAPQELKLTFGDKPVTDVYRTAFVVFNRGSEAIRNDDVVTKIAVHFSGANILREPTIKLISKQDNKFSAKRVVKEGNNAIELDFLYLDRHDGAVIEAIHTKCTDIRCSGTIVSTKGIRSIGYFMSVPHAPTGIFGLIRLMFGSIMLASGVGIFSFGALTSSLAEFWFTRGFVPFFSYLLARRSYLTLCRTSAIDVSQNGAEAYLCRLELDLPLRTPVDIMFMAGVAHDPIS